MLVLGSADVPEDGNISGWSSRRSSKKALGARPVVAFRLILLVLRLFRVLCGPNDGESDMLLPDKPWPRDSGRRLVMLMDWP